VTGERVASPVRLALTGILIAALAAGSSLLAGRIALGPDRDRLLGMAPAGGEAVRREPAQYWWVHRRWRGKPGKAKKAKPRPAA
jgi:hypothetical protein